MRGRARVAVPTAAPRPRDTSSAASQSRRKPGRDSSSSRYVVVGAAAAALQLFHHRPDRLCLSRASCLIPHVTVYPSSLLPSFVDFLYQQEVASASLFHLRLASLVQAARPGERRSYIRLPHSFRIWLQSPGHSKPRSFSILKPTRSLLHSHNSSLLPILQQSISFR